MGKAKKTRKFAEVKRCVPRTAQPAPAGHRLSLLLPQCCAAALAPARRSLPPRSLLLLLPHSLLNPKETKEYVSRGRSRPTRPPAPL